jgi:hypothetical protein
MQDPIKAPLPIAVMSSGRMKVSTSMPRNSHSSIVVISLGIIMRCPSPVEVMYGDLLFESMLLVVK